MYSLIYRLRSRELGTGLMSVNMERTYPGLFQSVNIDEAANLPSENRIWQIQNPYAYSTSLVDRVNDHVFIRESFAGFFPGRKMTNGFSYLKRHRGIYNHFLPTIYQSSFGVSDEPAVGYYARDCRTQSNLEFLRFARSLPKGARIVTMGTRELICDRIPGHLEWMHTYDQKRFWESCSHYFYYRCSDIEDPLPHTLLEAIQSMHRIISPRSGYRRFEDGIDDLLSCTEFDEEFIPDNRGVWCEHLRADNWRPFINRIADNGFAIDYPVNRGSFREWMEDIL